MPPGVLGSWRATRAFKARGAKQQYLLRGDLDAVVCWARVSSVPISRVRCPKCPGGSPAEYVAWGDTNAPEADRREASALLAELVEKDHSRHKAVYSGMTLEELRQRVGRKASSAGS